MYSLSETDTTREFVCSSQVALVDRVVAECRAFALQEAAVNTTPMEQVLRELLLNAIEHGNQGDAQKRVWCRMERIGEARYQVTVRDEGSGFNVSARPLPAATDPHQTRSRGYAIITLYADEVRSAESGGVTVYLTLPREVLFTLNEREDKDTVTITSSGDLTASVADKFRTVLLGAFALTATTIRLDLGAVTNIDSICLSVLALFSKTVSKSKRRVMLTVVNAADDIRDLFRMTRLDDVYRCDPAPAANVPSRTRETV